MGKRPNPPVDEHVIAEFWRRVPERPVGGCWRWAGEVERTGGYGFLRVAVGGVMHTYKAHRLSYYLEHGVWPEPLCMHDCRPSPDDRLCCNPAHLRAGTVADNNRDQSVKGVANNQYKGKRFCPRGHAWTAATTIWRAQKGKVFRECRECALTRKRLHRSKTLHL